ncbi:gas vesicle protein [Halobacteria archaeon AArc-dxtr1]|nr:gas vesicle protein [Halobacteria archaeon AArc-dxtr1]
MSDSQTAQQEEQEQDNQQSEAIAPEGTTDPEDVDADELADDELDLDDADESKIEGVLAIRRTVKSTAGALVGHPFDGVSEITPIDDGWRATVEAVERRAVPDTQDIIGRYEIELDEDGVVQGYRRLDRYRRGDTASFE